MHPGCPPVEARNSKYVKTEICEFILPSKNLANKCAHPLCVFFLHKLNDGFPNTKVTKCQRRQQKKKRDFLTSCLSTHGKVCRKKTIGLINYRANKSGKHIRIAKNKRRRPKTKSRNEQDCFTNGRKKCLLKRKSRSGCFEEVAKACRNLKQRNRIKKHLMVTNKEGRNKRLSQSCLKKTKIRCQEKWERYIPMKRHKICRLDKAQGRSQNVASNPGN